MKTLPKILIGIAIYLSVIGFWLLLSMFYSRMSGGLFEVARGEVSGIIFVLLLLLALIPSIGIPIQDIK